jgi:hypothetical protein
MYAMNEDPAQFNQVMEELRRQPHLSDHLSIREAIAAARLGLHQRRAQKSGRRFDPNGRRTGYRLSELFR